MGEDKLRGKRSLHALLWERKGRLVKLKAEVDRALTSVLEGLESCGPGFKPKAVGRKKKWKKHWTQKKSPKEVWRLVLLCLMWCIWRERNALHFEDAETSMVELKKRLLNTLYIWIVSHHSLNVFTYADLLNLFSVRSY
jgi:hypothetical protein